MDANKLTLMGLSHSEDSKKFIAEMQEGFAEMGIDTDKAKIELFWEALADAYDDGRKKIISKAAEWFTEYLMEIGYPDDWLRDSPNFICGEERFHKAMEEKK